MAKFSHTKVVPTAYWVARARAVSDIFFAKEIFDWLSKDLGEKASGEILKVSPVTIEARYKLINKILLQHNPSQVLELACGLLPRGYEFSHKGVRYMETDLAEVVEQKKRMYADIFPPLPKNLFLESANALKFQELEKVLEHADLAKPLYITHEGLLRYLSFEEKAIVAKNIHSLLEKYGGAWITCDITLQKSVANEDNKIGVLASTKSLTGIDVSKNTFRDIAHAKEFFTSLGFEVRVHPLSEIRSELVTPKVLGLKEEEVLKDLEWVVVEMKVK